MDVPVQGGTWTWNPNNNDNENLSLTLTFPQSVARRDVMIDAGTTIQLSTKVYTQTQLDQLNKEFYTAREETWKLGGELNDIEKRRDAPKQWNDKTQQWEQPRLEESMASQVSKRLAYWQAQWNQQQKSNSRPNVNDLSSDPRGSLPGYEGSVFFQKQGIITIPASSSWRGDAVIGTWSAEPILATTS